VATGLGRWDRRKTMYSFRNDRNVDDDVLFLHIKVVVTRKNPGVRIRPGAHLLPCSDESSTTHNTSTAHKHTHGHTRKQCVSY